MALDETPGLSRFWIQLDRIRSGEVEFSVGRSYGGDAEIGKPFWSAMGYPRVIAMLSGDEWDIGNEWL